MLLTNLENEIIRIKNAIADAYSAIANVGGNLPSIQKVNGLATAINSIIPFNPTLFTANNTRTDYSYAFANTGYEELPITEITAKDIKYALMNCRNLITAQNVTITINNDNPSVMYLCANCTELMHAPNLIFKDANGENNAQVCKTWTSAFINCSKMETCKVYLGDGTQNPITTRNQFQNTFTNCIALHNLTFEGSGAPMYLDLSHCTELTRDSALSLKNSLMNVSNATSGNYIIKLADNTYNKFNSSELEEIENLGWTLESITTQENTN